MFEQIISLIAPHECIKCKKEGFLLCYMCQDELPVPPACCYRCRRNECKICPASLKKVFVATVYEGLAKELIHKLKFERGRAGAEDIARTMARRMPFLEKDGLVVSFVPTATARVRVRGYDQAALIALCLASLRGMQYAPLLSRYGQQRQVGQAKMVRQSQLQGAFRVNNLSRIRGKRILLVDDVLTTGATLEAAALVLSEAGAKRIDGAVFAAA